MSLRALSLLRWLALLLAVVVIALQVLAYLAPRQGNPVVNSGQADVGAPFTLTDHLGNTVSDQSLHGRAVVLYFGWVRDPDLTPAALQLLMTALERLGPKAETITAVFVTIDPERDSTSDLKTFVSRFHPRLVGLSGNKEQTDALVRAYKLYVAHVPDPVLPGNYIIDHASLYYVLGADGMFRGLVPYTTDVVALAGELQNLIK